ncbi:protein of unknown function (plasmid) [Cupriavidus taiwanensis]|uniref:Uncharacterized protein n=1 Tax=Cupriavidus taiwanensis TaxID=164546 RepID=A0A9Q7V360_9BURK|nr:protein of unknown function [Cupriavidus taiwanensis]
MARAAQGRCGRGRYCRAATGSVPVGSDRHAGGTSKATLTGMRSGSYAASVLYKRALFCCTEYAHRPLPCKNHYAMFACST